MENESTYIGNLLYVPLISTVHLVAEKEQAVSTSLSRHRVVCNYSSEAGVAAGQLLWYVNQSQ